MTGRYQVTALLSPPNATPPWDEPLREIKKGSTGLKEITISVWSYQKQSLSAPTGSWCLFSQ